VVLTPPPYHRGFVSGRNTTGKFRRAWRAVTAEPAGKT